MHYTEITLNEMQSALAGWEEVIKAVDSEAVLDESHDMFEIEKLSDVEHVLRIYRGNNRACNCGLPCCFSLEDARGIFCSFICKKCEEEVRSRYRPEIFTDSEPEDY